MANVNQARLEKLTDIISRTVTVEQVYLFGSYAYGTPNEDSDLDLYVVIPDGSIPPAEAVKRIRRALYPVQDMPMDVVACRASTFRQRQQEPSLAGDAHVHHHLVAALQIHDVTVLGHVLQI